MQLPEAVAMHLVPEAVPSRILLAGQRCKLLTACGKETARRYTCWERMQRDASAFCPIPAWRWLVQVLTTSQICVLGHCSLLSAYDMAIYHNTQQKQVFTAKLQLFHAGIILGFIQALYCSEFLLKAIFWKQNALSSSSHLENSAHPLLPTATGIMQKTNHESCSEGKNKAKCFQTLQHHGTKLKSVTPEPGPCSGPAPLPSAHGLPCEAAPSGELSRG